MAFLRRPRFNKTQGSKLRNRFCWVEENTLKLVFEKPESKEGFRQLHSLKEARRYIELRLLEKAGSIRDLSTQVNFPLKINGKLVCSIRPDFIYWDIEKNIEVIEDTKGFATEIWKLRRKLFEALTGKKIITT